MIAKLICKLFGHRCGMNGDDTTVRKVEVISEQNEVRRWTSVKVYFKCPRCSHEWVEVK